MLEVTVLLLNDNLASTALAPIEVFHSAGALWNTLNGSRPTPRFRVTAASLDGAAVSSPYGVSLAPQASISDIEKADVIIVPASGLDLAAQFTRHEPMFSWLRGWHEKGAYIAGICSGAAYLAEAGLLDGRLATTHWAIADMLRQRYPKVRWRTDMFITEDRRVLCSGGVYASIDLSLYLVKKFCGHEVAVQCAKSLLVDMPRMHQSGYAVLPLSRPHSDGAIRKAEELIAGQFARELSTELLAAKVSMSARTFIRRFKAATGQRLGSYLQALRISVAREMLEDGARSVQAVSSAVGYEDSAFFRSLFKRHTGMTPAEYRNRFSRTRHEPGTESARGSGFSRDV